jgi:hypothetical protein
MKIRYKDRLVHFGDGSCHATQSLLFHCARSCDLARKTKPKHLVLAVSIQPCASANDEDRRRCPSLAVQRAPTGQYRMCNTGYGTPGGRRDSAGRKRHLPSLSTFE